MKKTSLPLLVSLLMLVSNLNVKAQMVLASSFPGDKTASLAIVDLSISGKKIAVATGHITTGGADTIFYYNTDYSFWKKIIIPGIPGSFPYSYFNPKLANSISYSSETLFNTDTFLEAAVFYYNTANSDLSKILIINEHGTIVDSILNVQSSYPFTVHELSPTSFYATVTTSSGPKIYSLPGTIPCSACGSGGGTLGLVNNEVKPAGSISAPVPNPSKDQVKITFTLPDGAKNGVLTIYTSLGQELRSYNVDNRFGFIMVDDSQFAPGMYFYNLTVNGVVTSTQKMLVIK